MKTIAIKQTFQTIRHNKFFELFVIFIIIFSALVVGVKTYSISPVMLQVISILDWLITIFFLIEICIRFISEENKKDFFKNGWNIFDTLVVTISLIPIENSEMAVVGRLIRIFRVLRMISIIPDLRILLTSLMKAMPQLGYIVLMLFIIFYIYAAVGSIFFEAINPTLWGNISISMLTLFRIMTFEGWADIMYESMAVYPLSWMYYLSFIFLTTFAFLNMVIGIVVNVLDEEHRAARLKKEQQTHPLTLEDLDRKIERLMEIIETKK
ncbi:ion transporter [Candidatus Marithrix sp. Canyon 246]|uniref:ion transporter n=1 Tax=Candidatus Marithrix sp. Canyon 246 TaxID=1827136 RepID=UPI00084A0B2A|nr:ion transporter [Candidatus Marithrix sp. Canyon 246]